MRMGITGYERSFVFDNGRVRIANGLVDTTTSTRMRLP